MFDARMSTTLAQRLVSIVSSMFDDQTCFNRLATHFNISMVDHQTMFDGVWSPNISRLSRSLATVIKIEEMSNKSANTKTKRKVLAFRDVYQGECKRLVGFVKLILL